MSTIQILLLSLFIAFMACETYWWGGCLYIARPITAAPIIGLLMGDFKTGLICGAMIEMVFLGGLSMGAYTPPNSYIGGMVGTALAIMAGGNVELGVALAYPIGLLVQWLNYVVTTINQIWVERAEGAIKQGNTKMFSFWHHMSIFTILFVRFFLPTFLALILGSSAIEGFYNSLPAWVTSGMKVASGILPAIGLASILNTLGLKKAWPYFLLGFILAAYLKLDTMFIALLGIILSFIILRSDFEEADISLDLKADKKDGVLDKNDFVKMFFRSFSSMGSFNYKSYNAIGYLYGIIPGLEKIYKDEPEKLKESYARNVEFFNTHPFFKNLIMGIGLSMEEENANNPNFDTKVISSTKAALMGPLAGIGDSVFQGTFRVLFSAIGAGLALNGNIGGPILYTIANLVLAWGTRWWFLKGGYEYGTALVKKLRTSNLFEVFVKFATIIGMMVIGGMIANFVSVSFGLNYVSGETTITLQSIFDAVMPKFLPLLTTLLMYKIIKDVKGGIYYCLIGTFVVAFLGVLIGLF